MMQPDKAAWAKPLISLGVTLLVTAGAIFLVKLTGGFASGAMRHLGWVIVGIGLGGGVASLRQGLEYRKLA